MSEWIEFQSIYTIAGARDKFEDLIHSWLKEKYKNPDTYKIECKRGDDGLDIIIGKLSDQDGVICYQCKWFLNELGLPQKQQIKKSFETANSKNKLKKWILVLPKSLNKLEISWWESFQLEYNKPDDFFELISDEDILNDLFKESYIHLYRRYWKKIDSSNITEILELVKRSDKNPSERANIMEAVELLIDKNKTKSAFEVISVIKKSNAGLDKVELDILEVLIFRKSHNYKKVFEKLEVIKDYANDLQNHKINIILADIYRTLANNTKASEYLNSARKYKKNSSKIEIIQELINLENPGYKTPKEWLVGDDKTRERSLAYFVKALSCWQASNHKDFEHCITLSLEHGQKVSTLNTLYLDIEHYFQRLIQNQIGTKEELFKKYNFLENELKNSEITTDWLGLKTIRLKILINKLAQPQVDEGERLILECYELLSQMYCDKSFLLTFGFLMENFPIPDQFIKIIFEKMNESEVKLEKVFISYFLSSIWSRVEFLEISNFLSKHNFSDLTPVFKELDDEDYSKFISTYLDNFSIEDLKVFIRLQKNLSLSVKLLEYLPKKLQEDQEFIRINLLQRYATEQEEQWIEASKLLENLDLDNCNIEILLIAQSLAHFTKKYDIELKAIKRIKTQGDQIEFQFLEGLNYYNQTIHSKAYQILSAIITKLPNVNIQNKKYILVSYLEVLIQTNNEDENLNSIDDIYGLLGDFSTLDKENKFKILLKFAQYKKQFAASREEIGCIFKQAFRLFDTIELGSFDTRRFTFAIDVLLGLDEKVETRAIEVGDYVQLSDQSWFSLNTDLVLDSIKISKDDSRFIDLLGKNIGDTIELESQKYTDQKSLKIVRYGKFESYLMMRAFEEIFKLSKVDPKKYGYVIQSDDIVTETRKLISDLTGINKEIITQFENNEIPFYILATYSGGVGSALEQARYSNGYIKSNLGTGDDISKQYETVKKAHKNNLPIYIDYLSAITVANCGLLDSLLANFTNLYFPVSFVEYLRNKALSLKNPKLQGFIGINIKSGGINLNEIDHSTALQTSKLFYDCANKVETKANVYEAVGAEQKPNHIITQKITSDIVDACVLAQNNPDAVVFTEEPTYLYHNNTETGNRLPQYFSTWILSKFLYDKDYINLDFYLDCFYRLTGDRHYHLSPASKDLFHAIYGDSKIIQDIRTDRLHKLNLRYILDEKYTRSEYSISQLGSVLGSVLISPIPPKLKYEIYSKIIPPLLLGSANKRENARKIIYETYSNLERALQESQKYSAILFEINPKSKDFNILRLVIEDYLNGKILYF